MYLLLPLLSAVLYVCAALFLKQAGTRGASLWAMTVVANLICAVSFSALWVLGGQMPPVSLWWQPAVVALLFLAGQVVSFLALTRGDVSVATPVLGLKVVLVAALVTLVTGEAVSGALWTAAVLSSAGIVFLNRGDDDSTPHHARLTLALGAIAAAAFALFDVLVQHWTPAWGAGRFLPVLMWMVGLASLAAVPFLRPSIGPVPRPAWRPLGLGSALIALQGLCLITALALYGQATAVNVVYSSRGLWSVLAVWWAGHWFGNAERHRGARVLGWRLAGAALLMAAVVTVVVER